MALLLSRGAVFFETGNQRHAWLNNNIVVVVTKSRIGVGGPIHRVFTVK